MRWPGARRARRGGFAREDFFIRPSGPALRASKAIRYVGSGRFPLTGSPGCKSYLILVDASTKTILARNYSFRPQTLIKPQIMREALREAHGPNLRAKRREDEFFWPPPKSQPNCCSLAGS